MYLRAAIAGLAWILWLVAISACTSEPPPAPVEAEPDEPVSTMTEAPREPLDLSLPDDFFADETLPEAEPLPPKFDAGALFAEEEDSATSIMVLPQAEDGELPREISEVEGATVTIETKTR